MSTGSIEKHQSFDDSKLEGEGFEGAKFEGKNSAKVYLQTEPAVKFTLEEENKLYRRMDWRVLPILSLLYLLSFMDRGNIGNAKLSGLEADLGMSSNPGLYAAALSAYFATYCLFELPANLMLKWLPPSMWLGSITIAWGLVMLCMGLVSNFAGLVACRLFLGITEAGLFPGVVLLLTFFYPRHRGQFRLAIFFSAATLAGAFSGLLAYGISFINVGGYSPWRWIFGIEGLMTMVAGVGAIFAIVDSLDTLKCLNPDEKAWLKWKKFSDSGSVGEAEHISAAFILSAVTNWQVYLSTAYYISIVIPLYSIGLTLPSIILSTFGAQSRATAQLITVPVYAIACTWVLICAYFADKMKTRYRFVLLNQCLALLGFIINICPSPAGLKYFGLILAASGSYGGLPTVVTWLGNNLSGQTKRGVGMAIQIGIGNLGAICSSNIFRPVDAPRNFFGYGVNIAVLVVGMGCSTLYAWLLTRENARKAAIMALPVEQRPVYSVAELRIMGDTAPEFVYTV